ncbi:ATP-binding protein [Burkholderia sp. GS2Y]|uniref:histidine kinase n=1 Tax=Burkholderia theae TaxID=3143496 RepID=A0ABU9WI72_9BURK
MGGRATLHTLLVHGAIALDRVQDALARARASGERAGLGHALLELAAAHLQRNAYDAGADCAALAQRWFDESEDVRGSACALYYRGLCCDRAGDSAGAIRAMHEALERFAAAGSTFGAAIVLDRLGIILVVRGAYDTGLDCLSRAIAMLLDAPVPGLLPILRNNWIWGHLHCGRHAMRNARADRHAAHVALALDHLREIERMAADEPSSTFAAARLDTAAQVYLAAGHDEPAERHAQRAAAIAEQFGSAAPLAHMRDRSGDIALARGQVADALQSWRIACDGFAECGLDDERCEVALKAAEAAEPVDAAEAFAWYRRLAQFDTENDCKRAALRREIFACEREHERDAGESKRVDAAGGADRLASLGRVIAGINHEFKNPLAAVRLAIENCIELVQHGRLDEVTDDVARIGHVTERLAQLTNQFGMFAERRLPDLEPVSLYTALDEALAMVAHRLGSGGPDVRCEGGDMCVWAHLPSLCSVFVNLIGNAIDATVASANRKVMVAISTVSKTRVEVIVRDNGPGFSPEAADNLFEAFFTTKPAGVGLGLGLALARDWVAQMNGCLTARNHPDGGAELRVSLPRVT